MARKKSQPLKFDQRLILQTHMLGLFGMKSLEQLSEDLRADTNLEFLDDEGRSRFHHAIAARLPQGAQLTRDVLRAFDENIVKHTRTINRTRAEPVRWKYFQYLALLFTEIYLERLFRDAKQFAADINTTLDSFNKGKDADDQLPGFVPSDLNKVCLWMATGAGKTLLMHVNILQYHHYLALHGRAGEVNRVILLTPNEGLSNQHLGDLHESGFARAELFRKDNQARLPNLSDTPTVEIIDIHKLDEEEGEKTVAIDSFESNNLVLVDEGHTGASGDDWMDKRDRLCLDGFSFEYSATFGQAMKASKRKNLQDRYAKAVLFDYSYRYFYGDGYGKNYWILNLAGDGAEEARKTYLTACLLTFYEQLRLFDESRETVRPYRIERPLLVFVGGSVSAVRTENKRKVSDVLDILLFLADFCHDATASKARISRLLSRTSGILDQAGSDLFGAAFPHLIQVGQGPEQVYTDLLRRFFNSPGSGKLHVELLRGTDGELALRIADNPPFGVINVGDAPALRTLCEQHADALVVSDRQFADGLFDKIKRPDSTIQLVIGSKKFTQGWNSFRVSALGLMNIGKSEGPEIIQLFGRGVRLRGFNGGLKRSSHVRGDGERPAHLSLLETLSIFGVKADYMTQFKEYLEEEGVPVEAEPVEFVMPTIRHLGFSKLKTVTLDDNVDFERDADPFPLAPPTAEVRAALNIRLDWHPRVQSLASAGLGGIDATANEVRFTPNDTAFIDWQALHWNLNDYKTERGHHKLTIEPGALQPILEDASWYTLKAPANALRLAAMRDADSIQELATALMKRYVDRYYKVRRDQWERKSLRLQAFAEGDPNINVTYTFLIEASKTELVAKLKELKKLVEKGAMTDFEFGSMRAIMFGRHLYRPLIHLAKGNITVSPVELNAGERDFVLDLRDFHESNPAYFKDADLYLLRNLSRGKGIGFFEAGNFYPDFILWLVVGNTQHVVFVDPKGIARMDVDHPKIQFHAKVKELETQFTGQDVTFDSFIVSVTPFAKLAGHTTTRAEFAKRHVLFQHEDKATYVKTILDTARKATPKVKP